MVVEKFDVEESWLPFARGAGAKGTGATGPSFLDPFDFDPDEVAPFVACFEVEAAFVLDAARAALTAAIVFSL